VIDDILRTGTVNDLKELLGRQRFPQQTLILLEMQPQHVINSSDRKHLLHFNWFGKHPDIAPYTTGRIFHPDFELRWQRQNGQVEVVYLGTPEGFNMPQLTQKHDQELACCEVHERCYYLFGTPFNEAQSGRGEQTDRRGVFAEVRIPRLLHYPIEQRVQIVVREYVHRETGQLIIFRFEKLISVGG